MSRALVPRIFQGGSGIEPPAAVQRQRKISTACGACKQRKTRCTGGSPCEACATRSSPCIYDVTADQRRKIANQRNVQDLAEAQQDLEKHRQLLGGIIATIRAGDYRSNQELVNLIRTGVDLSQLAAHVRNECRSSLEIQDAYESIEFVIDGENNLPSPGQILAQPSGLDIVTFGGNPHDHHMAQAYSTDLTAYGLEAKKPDDTQGSDAMHSYS